MKPIDTLNRFFCCVHVQGRSGVSGQARCNLQFCRRSEFVRCAHLNQLLPQVVPPRGPTISVRSCPRSRFSMQDCREACSGKKIPFVL
jgi:hypothetical protein